jgi:hypothetical protein
MHERPRPRLIRTLALALVTVFLAGCGDGSGPVDREPQGDLLPPLEPGTWYLHQVEGRPVPGVVLTPPAGAGLERIQVDSARFEAHAGGSLTYEGWVVQTLADGSGQNVSRLGIGSWVAGSEAYTISLGGGGAALTLEPVAGGALVGQETLPTSLGGAIMPVVYRAVPPPSPAGGP